MEYNFSSGKEKHRVVIDDSGDYVFCIDGLGTFALVKNNVADELMRDDSRRAIYLKELAIKLLTHSEPCNIISIISYEWEHDSKSYGWVN